MVRTWPSFSVKFSLFAPTWIISSSMPVRTVQGSTTISTTLNGWHSSACSPLWTCYMRLVVQVTRALEGVPWGMVTEVLPFLR
ncbi:hypothetical protein BJY52DRAFT_135096 [Lactarius psammicola]|nr:hypothetical protein BJY52DRAFT_135096 [Lactarius psammicola]